MFNKLLLKLSIVLIAVLAMSASPATANCSDSHKADDVVPGYTVDVEHPDEVEAPDAE